MVFQSIYQLSKLILHVSHGSFWVYIYYSWVYMNNKNISSIDNFFSTSCCILFCAWAGNPRGTWARTWGLCSPAWFPPIKNLNGSSNLDYRCWNRGCSNSSYNCLWSFLSLYARDIAPMDDYFHRNRTTKLALLVHWLEFYFSNSISTCLMLPSALIRH